MNKKLLLLGALLAICLPVHAANFTTSPLLSTYTSDDVGNLTLTGRDAWDSKGANTPSITINGSSSGASIVQAPATGGGTLTLPAGTATLAATTGPVPVACGTTCTIANTKGFTLLNQAAGSTATLPGATGTGNSYKLLVTVLTTSGAEKILTNPTTDTIIGTAQGENGGTAKVFVGNAAAYHSIQMPFTGSQPSGGFIGDEVECTDVATGIWECNLMYQAGTTPTTPYSASTS